MAKKVTKRFSISHFSKRQGKIMGYLLNLTLNSQRYNIHIPTLKDWENCGISQSKIKQELEQLVEMKVIFWDKDKMEFSFNVNTDEWQAKLLECFSEDRCQRILKMNKSSEH
ncbi:replication protein [Peribacillus frigoritolerans]|uniref:replication protein n=1 Tax=Peribacillus frigoritolerans TaxID=450367 RepID=UPI0021CED700|nr:replication protein [Peribacillus frigoritolerans]MCU6603807.1 replication protein [Peribacillus frigoritolerans]